MFTGFDADAFKKWQEAVAGAQAGEPESPGVPTEQEVVEACVGEWTGGSWQDFLRRLETKRGLVVRKKGGAQ